MANPRRRRAIKAAKIAAIRAKRASSSVAAPVKVEEKVEKLMVDEPVIKVRSNYALRIRYFE